MRNRRLFQRSPYLLPLFAVVVLALLCRAREASAQIPQGWVNGTSQNTVGNPRWNDQNCALPAPAFVGGVATPAALIATSTLAMDGISSTTGGPWVGANAAHQPGTYGNPLPFAVGAARQRLRFNTLTATQIFILKKAFELVQALPDTDPRSMVRLAQIHCIYCSGDHSTLGEIHRNWYFLPFHRAFMYQSENIMRKLVHDWAVRNLHVQTSTHGLTSTEAAHAQVLLTDAQDFAFPYWDWRATDTSTAALDASETPAIYLHNAVNPSSTMLPIRNPVGPRGVVHSLTSTDRVLINLEWNTLMARPWNRFFGFGRPYSSTFIGFGWAGATSTGEFGGASQTRSHATPHNESGGWMYHGMHSTRQPLFFAHHSNIDRMWTEWTAARAGVGWRPPTTTFPLYGSTSTRSFIMPNEDGRWVRILPDDVIGVNAPADLHVTYGP